MSAFGNKLNPYRSTRKPLGIKGTRTSVVITNNPSTIDQNELLTVRFANLEKDDVVVPGTARLAFNIELTSGDKNRTIVNNLGRAIVKKISIKLDGTELLCIDDADVYYCYKDLWLTDKERRNADYQGIQTVNGAALRVGAENAEKKQPDKAIAEHYGNRFYIPLEFELDRKSVV